MAFIAAHPDALVYHHPAWLRVLGKIVAFPAVYLACQDQEGQLRGVLPLLRTRGPLTGRGLASLPRTPVAGLLASDREAAAALLRAAVERTRARPGQSLQLKHSSADLDGLVEGMACQPWELTYHIELPDKPEALRFGDSRNHSRIKWAINKAARLGVNVRPAETEAELRAWYDLYLDTMRWHTVPPRPYRFFKACWDELRPAGLMWLLLAEQHEDGQVKLLAGSMFFAFGRTVCYAFNGRHKDALSLRPNDAIQWRALHDACAAGFRRYDMGAVVGDNQGLAEFKSKWGAEPSWVYKYLYPAPTQHTPAGHESESRFRRLANSTWRRLPLRATAILGDLIFSYL